MYHYDMILNPQTQYIELHIIYNTIYWDKLSSNDKIWIFWNIYVDKSPKSKI